MLKKLYNWKRYWSPFGENLNIDQMGYLYDPASEMGKYINSNMVFLDTLNEIPCLILLGPPSSGKSKDVEKYYNEFKEKLQ